MPEKILIVDDDLDTLKLVGLILQRHGYQIVAANGGLQALSKASAERPDMILLDLMMPDLDGYEVARRLRSDAGLAHIPIIMFTAKTMLDDKVAGFEAGADDYLTKPTHPSELIAHVKALMARSQGPRATSPLPERGKLVGVLSAKGGVGVTTVTVNMAALAMQSGQDVAVADLHPGSGSLGLMLGLSQAESLSGLVGKPAAEVTTRLVQDRLASHPSGLRVLAAPAAPGERQFAANAPQFEAVARGLSAIAKLCFADLGTGLGEVARRVVPLCDMLVIVTEPTRVAVTQTRALVDELATLGIATNRMELVLLNRAPTSIQLSWQQVEQILGGKLAGIITPAVELAYQAAEAGSPMVLLRPDTLAVDQLRTITTDLLQKIRTA